MPLCVTIGQRQGKTAACVANNAAEVPRPHGLFVLDQLGSPSSEFFSARGQFGQWAFLPGSSVIISGCWPPLDPQKTQHRSSSSKVQCAPGAPGKAAVGKLEGPRLQSSFVTNLGAKGDATPALHSLGRSVAADVIVKVL